ncbi:polyprenyl diphosphate synthase [Pyrobaculum neutrophilum]|uniref:Tritrans,polycis-undecaprenyl-diphosphate synthase (geranylgeranyl-diphosphate specific) n=1 Tax=Pyrobaculum neutrophilum (strain DSM 2338 / JCM 9278 / NBRC 100436 / V24Sta) TaxID=444157 RepID=B1YAZ5_PYRNV|nr:polyprenyl diphosphate synthase [Pyrobaculum neutrophilum]ACB40695.1 undecaprenyl diphosphate synthase [Pyrobaculum neutrophilum V24Sta]
MWESGSVKIPSHIAVIPDGNRRYAKKAGLDFYHAYKRGVEKVRSFLLWTLELREIRNVTFYALSTENLRRSRLELEILFRIFEEEFRKTLEDPLIHDNRVRIRFIGDRSPLPGRVVKLMEELESVTRNYTSYNLTFALGYGGRAEIVRCVKRLLSGEVKIADINEDTLFQCLDTRDLPNPEPDVVVRTGGEKRLSNFLLYQAAYSELIFLDKLWPEVEREDLAYIVEEYSRRQRRFGR